jgi:hypothetical protein
MAQLFTNRQRRLQARIAAKETLLGEMETALSAGLAEGVKEYSFSSGPGDEKIVNFSPTSLRKQISILEKEIEHLYAKIEGTGVVNVRLRRKG